MKDMGETKQDDGQQGSTSMTEQRNPKQQKSSNKVHPKPGVTDCKRVDLPPPKKSSSLLLLGVKSDNSDSHLNTKADQQKGSNQDRLFECAKEADITGINEILESNNVNVDAQDKNGLTALHYAAKSHHHAAVRVLLKNNADVNKKSGSGLTPLLYACRNEPTFYSEHQPDDQVFTVNELLTHGANLNDTDGDGFNALHHCAIRGPLEICRLLMTKANKGEMINAKTNQGWTPLHIAIMQTGDSKPGKHKAKVVGEDKNKISSIPNAVVKGNVDAVKLLLSSQTIDPNVEDKNEYTPLMLASKYGNTEITGVLLSKKECKINYQNKRGMSALHYAALYDKTNVVAKLIELGAKDLANIDKKNAFHLACEYNILECARKLRDKKYAKDTPDANGFAPFMYAVAKGCEEIVQDLMDSGGSDPYLELGDGKNVLHIAAKENRLAVLKILLDGMYNDILEREKTGQMSFKHKFQKLLDAEDRERNTPLHIAIQFGHVEVFEILCKYGADPFLPDAEMRTPLHIASAKGLTSIIESMALRNREFLNKKDGNGDTVYHLVAKDGHDRLLDVLLREDEELIAMNENNDRCTPLWLAAASGHLKCVEHLSTRKGLINEVNKSEERPDNSNNKPTPLMVASEKGHVDVVKYMLDKDADVSALDEKGHNCLEIAIINHHESVAKTIIESKKWEIALRNYTEKDEGMECTPFRKLIRHMPDTAKAVLDRCMFSSAKEITTSTSTKYFARCNEYMDDLNFIKKWKNRTRGNCFTKSISEKAAEEIITDGEEKDQAKCTKYFARFNFEFIDDLYFTKEWKDSTGNVRTRDMKATETQYSYKKGKDKPNTHVEDCEKFQVQHPMMIMSEAGQLNLLVHPVVKGLRQHKWNKFARSYYYVFFVIYAVYLSFLTAYVIMTPPPFAIRQSSCEEYYDSGYRRPLSLHVVKTFLYFLISLNATKELIQLFMRRWNYLNYVNITEIILFVTSFLFVIDFDGCQYFTNYRNTFQWNLGAVSIVLSWVGIVLFSQNWPDIGIYVVMFENILRTFVKFFIVFLLFIVGFGLGFFCLLQNQTSFSTAPYAILRTSVMMIGELDFNGVFHDDVVHYWITYVLFCIFLIVMTIVIMNLMIGLAIDDIKAVKDHAKLKRIQMKVKLVLDVERLLLSVSKYRLGGYWIWPPGWYIDVYVKSFDSEEDMKENLSKDAENVWILCNLEPYF